MTDDLNNVMECVVASGDRFIWTKAELLNESLKNWLVVLSDRVGQSKEPELLSAKHWEFYGSWSEALYHHEDMRHAIIEAIENWLPTQCDLWEYWKPWKDNLNGRIESKKS
jgi:hypothetical protein